MSAPLPASPEAAPRILVIGYGNPGRQDDGLGPAAAEAIAALNWPGVTTWDNDQLTIEDAVDVAAHPIVWFVDADRAGPEPMSVRPLTPALDIQFTSHLVSPETVLAIARQQFGARPEAHLLGIRGYTFDFDEGLSDAAARNLDLAVAYLRRQIEGRLRCP